MPNPDYYSTLGISPSATQAEIKRAYRNLAKQFHPDSQVAPAGQGENSTHDQIVQINAAYEVLGDVQKRQRYDRDRLTPGQGHVEGRAIKRDRQQRTAQAQDHYRQQRQTKQADEEQWSLWIQYVYTPVNRRLAQILNSLKSQVNALAADPFDDDLMEAFQIYLEDCRSSQEEAQQLFRSMPNPPKAASFAANLYYCLNQVSDGIDELERFTTCYDESYLHTGQEMFRIAKRMQKEAQAAYRQVK